MSMSGLFPLELTSRCPSDQNLPPFKHRLKTADDRIFPAGQDLLSLKELEEQLKLRIRVGIRDRVKIRGMILARVRFDVRAFAEVRFRIEVYVRVSLGHN